MASAPLRPLAGAAGTVQAVLATAALLVVCVSRCLCGLLGREGYG